MIEQYKGQKIARMAMYEVKSLMTEGYMRLGYVENRDRQEYYLQHPNGNCAMLIVWLNLAIYHVYINNKLVKSVVA